MTYQEFCKLYLDDILNEYYDTHYTELTRLELSNTKPHTSSLELINFHKSAETDLANITNYILPPIKMSSELLVQQKVKSDYNRFDKGRKEIIDRHQKELNNIEKIRLLAISNAENNLDKFIEGIESSLAPLRSQIDLLKNKKEEIEKILSLYGLASDKFEINLEELSLEELGTSLKLSLYSVESMGSNRNIFQLVLSGLYFSIDPTFTSKIEDPTLVFIIKVVHFISLLLLFYLLKPYFMAGVSICYIATIFANLIRVRERKELLQFAHSLSNGLDINYFIESSEDFIRLSEELEKAQNMDLTYKINFETKRCKTELDLFIEKNDPAGKVKELSNLYAKYLTQIAESCKVMEAKVRKIKESILHPIKSRIKDLEASLDELSRQFKPLGKNTSTTKTLNLEVAVAAITYKHWRLAEARVKLDLKNVLFLYKDESDYNSQINHIKLLLTNYLANVKYLELCIDLLDVEDLGRDFVEFNHEELQAVITTHIDSEENLLKSYVQEAAKRIRKLGKKTIIEYNKECEEKKMLTLTYKILLIVSSKSNIFSSKEYSAFLEHSANVGLFVWVIQTSRVADEKLLESMKIAMTKMMVSDKAYSLNGFYKIEDYPSTYTPYEYKSDFGYSIMDRLLEDYEKDPGDIRYWTDFMEQYIPVEKQWTYTTLDGIALMYGYRDGNPSLGGGVTLCDAPVHGLMIGATGAGKSALANFIIACLVHMYPPEWLEIVLLDLKNAEFPPLYAGLEAMPHVRLISGTKDGAYAISIYKYIEEEIKRRTKLFAKYKVNHIKLYNEIILAGRGLDGDKIIPRLLFYIDEFTVMYLEIAIRDLTIIDKKQTNTTNVARFCGIHLLFQTQNFSGTMNKQTMSQFSLRVSLRAASADAEQIIGSKAPSLLPKRGQCYTNESLGEDQSTTKRWIIPFIPVEEIHKYKPKLKEWCIKGPDGKPHIDRKPPYYDEDLKHNHIDLETIYAKRPILKADPALYTYKSEIDLDESKRTFILGERTAYTVRNVLQNNFRVTREPSENIAIACEDKKNMLDLVNTLIINLREKGIAFTGNVQDRDNEVLLDLPNKVTPELVNITDSELDPYEFCSIIETLVSERMQDQLANHDMLFLFLISWEEMQGIGTAIDHKLLSRYRELMIKSTKVNIYFVIVTRTPKALNELILACKHKITGKLFEGKDMLMFIGDDLPLPENFAVYKKSTTEFKFKIYDCPLVGTIAEKEMVLLE